MTIRILCLALLACACTGNISLGEKGLLSQAGISGSELGGTLATGGVLLTGGVGSISDMGMGGTLATGGAIETGVPTSGKPFAASIAAAQGQTCALLNDGSLRCWGKAAWGANAVKNTVPVLVSSVTGAVSLSSPSYGFYAILQAGTVQGLWNAVAPAQVPNITNALTVAAGESFSCALLDNGLVQCWKDGSGSVTTPVTVRNISNATAISVEGCTWQACAVLSSGVVQCWDSRNSGQLGNGTTTDSSTPVTVAGVTNATAVSVGCNNRCVVLDTGQVQCGADGTTQIPNITNAVAVSVDGITNADDISDGGKHACALLRDGTIRCWGGNGSGQLGNGTTANSDAPVTVSNITDATAVSVGAAYSCAIVNNGSISCWGDNQSGELGDGTSTNSSVPVTVVGF